MPRGTRPSKKNNSKSVGIRKKNNYDSVGFRNSAIKRIDRLEKRIAKQSARSGAVRYNTIKRLYNKKDLATSIYK